MQNHKSWTSYQTQIQVSKQTIGNHVHVKCSALSDVILLHIKFSWQGWLKIVAKHKNLTCFRLKYTQESQHDCKTLDFEPSYQTCNSSLPKTIGNDVYASVRLCQMSSCSMKYLPHMNIHSSRDILYTKYQYMTSITVLITIRVKFVDTIIEIVFMRHWPLYHFNVLISPNLLLWLIVLLQKDHWQAN